MSDSTHAIMLDGDAIFGVDEVAIRVVRRFLSRAYVFGDGGTHWDGCELAHHECAIIKATRLEAENERLRAENVRLIRELHIARGMLAEGRTTGHSIIAAAREAEDYIGMLLDDGNMQDGDA